MTTHTSDPHVAAPTVLDTRPEQPSLPQRLSVESFGLTDRGRVRPTNQDQFVVASLTRALRIRQSSLPQTDVHYADDEGQLFVVADGMGGEQGGEHASVLAVGTIEEFVLNTLGCLLTAGGPEDNQVLREFKAALGRADARVCEIAERHPHLKHMGTTLTMACSFGSDLFLGHVGDSRAYLLRGGRLHRMTRDHTLAELLVKDGDVPVDQVAAVRQQFGHVVTNIVGGGKLGIKAELHKVRLAAGDVVLLCTDGLTGMIAEADVADILRASPDPRRTCETLVSRAIAAGGKDNVTTVVVRYGAVAMPS